MTIFLHRALLVCALITFIGIMLRVDTVPLNVGVWTVWINPWALGFCFWVASQVVLWSHSPKGETDEHY